MMPKPDTQKRGAMADHVPHLHRLPGAGKHQRADILDPSQRCQDATTHPCRTARSSDLCIADSRTTLEALGRVWSGAVRRVSAVQITARLPAMSIKFKRTADRLNALVGLRGG